MDVLPRDVDQAIQKWDKLGYDLHDRSLLERDLSHSGTPAEPIRRHKRATRDAYLRQEVGHQQLLFRQPAARHLVAPSASSHSQNARWDRAFPTPPPHAETPPSTCPTTPGNGR